MTTPAQLRDLQEARRFRIGRLLLLARRDFLDRLTMHMGPEDRAVVAQARGRVLPYIDLEGTRSVELARRMGVTKQAIGRMVKELEAGGLLYREAIGNDPRAFLVRFTPPGIAFLERMNQCIQEIEQEYDAIAGAERMESVRDALALIVYGTPRPGRHGR